MITNRVYITYPLKQLYDYCGRLLALKICSFSPLQTDYHSVKSYQSQSVLIYIVISTSIHPCMLNTYKIILFFTKRSATDKVLNIRNKKRSYRSQNALMVNLDGGCLLW